MASEQERQGRSESYLVTALRKAKEKLSDALSKDKYLLVARETLTELGISLPEDTPFRLVRDLRDKPAVRISLRTPEQKMKGGIFCDIEVNMEDKPFGREIKIIRRVSTPDIDAETRLHFQSGTSIITLELKVDRVGEIRGIGRPLSGMYGVFHYASAEKKKNIDGFNKFLADFQKTPELSAHIPRGGIFDWKETVKGLVTMDLNASPEKLLGLGVVIPPGAPVA